MRIQLVLLIFELLLLTWFGGCIVTYKIGKHILVDGMGIHSAEFIMLLIYTSSILSYLLFPEIGHWIVLSVLIFWFIVQFFCHWYYTLFGASETKILGYNKCFKNTVHVFNVTMNNIVSSEGAAKTAMCALMAGAVLNVVLDPIFIYSLNLGIAGAAIATAISQMVSTVLFNVLMGLRRREINAVKYSDIDYINRTLRLRVQLGKKIRSKKEDFEPKTFTKQEVKLKTPSSERDIPIPDYVFEAILEQRKIYEKNRSRRTSVFDDRGYICCSVTGKPRSKDFHWAHYKKLLKENCLPDIRWHDLRSTFCTLLLKNDFNPKAVSKLMGHAKELITMDVYGDKREIIADCVDELQPFIDEVMPDPEEDAMIATENIEVIISAEDYLI